MSADTRPALDRHSIDTRPTLGRYLSFFFSVHLSADSVGELSASYRSTVCELSASYRSTIGELSASYI